MDSEKKLLSWLQDLYAIKKHSAMALESYAAANRDYPTLHTGITGHFEATKRHMKRIDDCLKALGHSHSTLGTAVATILGAGQTAASALLGDAILTNAAAVCAIEQLEVSSLTAIAVAAKKAKRNDCVKTCNEIMAEDSAMGAWMLTELPALTRTYLDQP